MTPTPLGSARARLFPVALLASALAMTTVTAPADAAVLRKTYTQNAPVNLGDPGDGPSNLGVTIPDSGPATPYPSQDSWPSPAHVVDVNVYLNFQHTNPDDVEVLLVGPGGQQALLMANAGGSDDFSGELIFDDEGPTTIPDAGPLVGGTSYRPAGYSPTNLPGPAPGLNGNSALSVFDGVSPVGDWKVFVLDDEAGGTGTFQWYVGLTADTAPYPSTIAVSGAGKVTDVNVSLNDLTSTYPDDIDLLLVGPQGQQATLMSDAGGSTDVTALDLTFDDEAATGLPDGLPLAGGTFQPTNFDDEDDIYPAPAPAPSGATLLSAFDGTDANGTWRLFAWDSVGGDFAQIAGWSLDIESDDSAAPTGSVVVAGGAAVVRSSAVTLGLSASDPAPGSGVTQMRFSNDGTTFGAWQAYAATAAWSLATGEDGSRTVYAQFADAFGNVSAAAVDTVTLDTTAPTAKKLTPAKNAKGVSAKTKIKVVASENLDKATVTKKTVLLKQGSKKIKAKVSLKKGNTIVLKPKKPLADGKYKVTVSKKVTDLAGNAFNAKKKKGTQTLKWTFTV